jgi:5-deoxy-glucuronate isomerase
MKMKNASHNLNHRAGFEAGYTSITLEGGEPRVDGQDTGIDTGIDFGIQKCTAGQHIEESHAKETVWLLIHGEAEISLNGKVHQVKRNSLFDEAPTALHLGPNSQFQMHSVTNSEWAVARAENEKQFEPCLFTPELLKPEYRGEGLVQGACLRNVRLIFDKTVRADANLVIGEVINFPGRWSSYPPHHHAQPEIYHYRFTEPQGYGHAELGETVLKVKENDTVKIKGGLDHAQVAAPGYGMYYLWIVRHLKDNPYLGFEFSEEHTWLLDEKNQGWKP